MPWLKPRTRFWSQHLQLQISTLTLIIIIEGGIAFTQVKFRALSNFLTLAPTEKLSVKPTSGLKLHCKKNPVIISCMWKIISHHAQQMHAHEVHVNGKPAGTAFTNNVCYW